jgi:hypothetical protein
MVRLLSEDAATRRSRAIEALHHEWAMRQIAEGVDGPTPEDRPEPSDYNQHVPDLEASIEAEDEFHDRLRAILAETAE